MTATEDHLWSDKLHYMERMQWSSRSSTYKGPKRLCTFCLFGVLLPIVCLSIPLYMRFKALRPQLLVMSPSDMKLLNHESRVSTFWCQSQEVTMNSTFNAYVLSTKPQLQRNRNHVKLKRRMILKDDIKEFWGFYLLQNSQVKLRVCSRYEGASFIIVKRFKDAKRCSYLGELDSLEEADEVSNEFEFEPQHRQNSSYHSTSNIDETILGTTSRNEKSNIGNYVSDFQNLSPDARHTLIQRLMNIINSNVSESLLLPFKDRKTRDVDDEDEVYDLQHVGSFDQHNIMSDNPDMSREETKSSWSSSEEALASCEGLLYNVALDGAIKCSPNASEHEVHEVQSEITLEVSTTGFYYFIFASENEITDNFLHADFDLHKTTFDVRSNVGNCTNSTDTCYLPLRFWSQEHIVLEVPDQESDCMEGLSGTETSLPECNRVITAYIACKPRSTVYMAFLLLVPVFILIFAYI